MLAIARLHPLGLGLQQGGAQPGSPTTHPLLLPLPKGWHPIL